MALILLGIAGVLFGGAVFTRSVSNARSNAWAGPRTKGQRGRTQKGLQDRGGAPRSLRHDLRQMTHEAHLSDWLDARKHDRAMAAKNGDGHTPTAPSAPPKVSRFGRRPSAAGIRQVIPGLAQRVTGNGTGVDGRPRPDGERFGSMSDPDFKRLLNDRQKAGLGPLQPTQTGGGSSPGAAPPGQNGNRQRNGWNPRNIRQAPGKPPPPSPPSRQASQTSQTSTSSGGTSTMASGSGSGVEQLVQGYNQIYTEAMAGNIHAKHAAIKALTEGFVRGSQMLAMLARELSEPGHNFGQEVTEPLAKASQHAQASSMATAESDAALASLLQMSVGELATSSRQAPHHNELSENGSR